MRKRLFFAAMLAATMIALADNTARVTALDGVTTADYASLQAALNACTGGETVTMLADETINSQVTINTDVTLDLNGHTISTSGRDFLVFSSNITATICGGGTVKKTGWGSDIIVTQGTTVNVTNCTLKGYCMYYGNHITGTLNIMADTVAFVDYPISGSSPAVLNIHAGHFAIAQGWREGNNIYTANINIMGGFFTRDPSFTGMMNSECGVMGASETLDGTTFTCKVVPKGEITNRARVTTSGGASTDYATLQTALNACTGGETVTMLATEEITSQLSIDASVEIDLANLSIKRTSGDFILVGYYSGSACTVTFRNGKVIGATGSCLKPWNSSVINVTNCVVTGSYGVYGASVGTVNILEDTLISFTYLAAGNSSASTLLNVRGGYVNYTTAVRSSGNGATIKLYGGYTSKAPDGILADGCRYVFAGELTVNYIKFYYRVMSSEEIAAEGGLEAEKGLVGYLHLQEALAQVQNNETIRMVKDVTASGTLMTQVGRSFTFDLGGHCLSRGGDVLVVMTNGIVRLRNGKILENNNSASCIGMRNGATLVVESTARIEGASGRSTNGIYMPGDNARVVFDGAQIATLALYSWGTAPNSTIEITGDSVMTCSRFQFSGNATLPPNVVATGGSFAINPTSYVTNNHVVLYRANASPCKWQVKPWAAICSNGWTFDLPAEAATVTGTCAAPSGSITVSLTGKIPTRKTLLADLSGLTLGSGTYADLSFVKSASLPGAVQVSYEDGKLYAWEAKGTLIVFQ